MKRRIAAITGVGADNGVTVQQLSEQLQDCVKQNQTESAFNKELHRLCQLLHSETYDLAEHLGFYVERQKGKSTIVYWTDAEERDSYLNEFEITEARALALYFVEQQLREIFPTQLAKQLEPDFSRAYEKLGHDDFKLASLFDVSRFGFSREDGSKAVSGTVEQQLGELFNALKAQHVICVDYAPVFQQQHSERLILSPQRIRYINSHLYLQAYNHESQLLHNYDISRIRVIGEDKTAQFIAVDFSQYQVEVPFRAHCNSWVKHYLESMNFAQPHQFVPLTADVWEATFSVTLPKDSGDNEPNPALLADFLGMFIDSIEVIEPRILRREIIARAGRLASLYSSDREIDKHRILRDSNICRARD